MKSKNIKSKEEIIQRTCQLSGIDVNYSHGRYEGRQLKGYNIFVCDTLYRGNHDGWIFDYECKLIDLLPDDFELPPRNKDGFLPREF